MFPKVDAEYKNQYCELGLWSLEEYNATEADTAKGNSFALGQIFIANYGLIMNQILDENGGVIVEFGAMMGSEDPNIWVNLVAFLFFVLLQIMFISLYSKDKFQRLARGAEVFKSIQKMNSEANVDVSSTFKKNIQQTKLQIDHVAGRVEGFNVEGELQQQQDRLIDDSAFI